mmetsp:Transcript_27454/g.20613  ORF Transcript_27454/g.20613 Transcript_27454/m.20613 type:complete len:90 (-) Transcript_27454:51-320(-)
MRHVPAAKAQEWCRANGNTPYYETSAMKNLAVEEAFREIAEIAVKKETEGANRMSMPTGIGTAQGAIKLTAEEQVRRSEVKQEKKKGCC